VIPRAPFASGRAVPAGGSDAACPRAPNDAGAGREPDWPVSADATGRTGPISPEDGTGTCITDGPIRPASPADAIGTTDGPT
jgi:hypothetical protein